MYGHYFEKCWLLFKNVVLDLKIDDREAIKSKHAALLGLQMPFESIT